MFQASRNPYIELHKALTPLLSKSKTEHRLIQGLSDAFDKYSSLLALPSTVGLGSDSNEKRPFVEITRPNNKA